MQLLRLYSLNPPLTFLSLEGLVEKPLGLFTGVSPFTVHNDGVDDLGGGFGLWFHLAPPLLYRVTGEESVCTLL